MTDQNHQGGYDPNAGEPQYGDPQAQYFVDPATGEYYVAPIYTQYVDPATGQQYFAEPALTQPQYVHPGYAPQHSDHDGLAQQQQPAQQHSTQQQPVDPQQPIAEQQVAPQYVDQYSLDQQVAYQQPVAQQYAQPAHHAQPLQNAQPVQSAQPVQYAQVPIAAGVATAVLTPEPEPPAAPAKPKRGRNHWLDAVRGVAVMRVVVWHTFASAFLSWTISTMPAMFFVAGSLLAYSLDKRPFDQLLRVRLKRLLIPYWVLGGLLLTVLALVHRSNGGANTDMSLWQFVAWLIPIVDPKGSAWEAGWISTPLWYLRCYLWMLLISPLLRNAHRKHGLKILGVPALGIFIVDFFMRNQELAPDLFVSVKWYMGDLVTYSFFLILGFAHHDGLAKKLTKRARLEWAGLGFAAGLIWVTVVDVPGNVVNNSYPMLLFIGVAWLALFLAFEKEMASLQTMRFTAPIMDWIGRRAMTVYLWHTTAIVFGYWTLAKFAPEANRIQVLPIIVIGIIVLTALFGWIEDAAAGKPAEWWPGKPVPKALGERLNGQRELKYVGLVGGLAMGMISISFLMGGATTTVQTASAADGGALNLPPAPSAKPPEVTFESASGDDGGGGLNLPPAPSAKPPEVEFESASGDAGDGGGLNLPPAPSAKPPEVDFDADTSDAPETLAYDGEAGDIESRIQAVIDRWREDQGIGGIYLGVSLPDGSQVLATSGVNREGAEMSVDADWPITSVTKTMTSAIILSLVDDGVIGLDDLIPELEVYPDYPFSGEVTFRQLLMHTSGIKTYKETDLYTAEQRFNDELDVMDALELSASQPLEWEPGTDVGYSSTGYITLGLVAAQLTDSTYEEVLQERIFDKADMPDSYLDTTPFSGWIGFSSGGVRSTLSDLLNWGSAMYRERTIVSDDSVEEIIDLDNPWSAGLGSYPVCPCVLDDEGNKVVASIGHNGGEATIQWSHEDNLVIAAGVTESWTNEKTQSHIVQLLLEVRNAVAGS